jgi:hypothetical protein
MLLHIIVDRNCSCLTDAVVKFAVSGILCSFLFLIFAAYGSCKNIKRTLLSREYFIVSAVAVGV